VARHKEKAADLLLDPKISQREDPKLWRSYELARMAALPDVMRYILRHNQDKLSTGTTEKWAYDVLKCRLDGKEVRELLQTLEINVQEVLFGNIAARERAIEYSIPRLRPQIWKHVLEETSMLDPAMLDSLLLYLRAPEARYKFKGLDHDEFGQIVPTLIQHGARDWGDAMTISMAGKFDELKTLVNADFDSVSIRRMLNVQDMQSRSILSHFLSRPQQHFCNFAELLDMVDLLLKHRSLVTVQDVMNELVTEGSEAGLVVGMMLLAEQKKGVASDVLHKLCTRRSSEIKHWTEYDRQIFTLLLRSGADPTLKNKNGKTPRDKLDEAPPSRWRRRHAYDMTSALLRRWEDYYRDPSIGNPSEQPDEAWVAVHDRVVRIAGEHRWALLVEKTQASE
jgi:hypothetical protein